MERRINKKCELYMQLSYVKNNLNVNNNIIIMDCLNVSHDNVAGFFSCCSVKLDKIVKYINENEKLPPSINSFDMFHKAKSNDDDDVTYEFFQHWDNVSIQPTSYPAQFDFHLQFINYKWLNYNDTCQIVYKYFSPSKQIQCLVEYLENRYKIVDYKNICVLFYRGNDKITETTLCDYNQIIEKANFVLKENPNVNFFIQSDETEFINAMTNAFPSNSFYIKEEIRHVNKNDAIVVDNINKSSNPLFSRLYLAITLIMSKCNYIVCTSGNCSLWIMLYRQHANNVHQFLNTEWV